MPTNTAVMGLPKPIGGDNATTAVKVEIPAAFDIIDAHQHGGGADGLPAKAVTATGRVQEKAGASVLSANNLTLGTDGNAFIVTGTTQINLIDTTGWQAGSVVTLLFQGVLTVKSLVANSGAFHGILLNGNIDWTPGVNSTLTLRYMNTLWYEIGRKA